MMWEQMTHQDVGPCKRIPGNTGQMPGQPGLLSPGCGPSSQSEGKAFHTSGFLVLPSVHDLTLKVPSDRDILVGFRIVGGFPQGRSRNKLEKYNKMEYEDYKNRNPSS